MFQKHSSLNHCLFFSIENQQKTNNELGEIKGIFRQIPIIIVFMTAFGAPQMTWQPHLSLLLHFVWLSLSSSLLIVSVGVAVLWVNKTGVQHIITIITF